MTRLIATMLMIVGVVHLLPVTGVAGGERLTVLYGLTLDDPNLQILMRHRAVLFGMLGVFILYCSFNPKLHRSALLASSVSVISFLYIAMSVSGYNSEVGRVFIADVIALICIIVAFFAYLLTKVRRKR